MDLTDSLETGSKHLIRMITLLTDLDSDTRLWLWNAESLGRLICNATSNGASLCGLAKLRQDLAVAVGTLSVAVGLWNRLCPIARSQTPVLGRMELTQEKMEAWGKELDLISLRLRRLSVWERVLARYLRLMGLPSLDTIVASSQPSMSSREVGRLIPMSFGYLARQEPEKAARLMLKLKAFTLEMLGTFRIPLVSGSMEFVVHPRQLFGMNLMGKWVSPCFLESWTDTHYNYLSKVHGLISKLGYSGSLRSFHLSITSEETTNGPLSEDDLSLPVE